MTLKEGVKIVIAGKERLVRLNINACVEFEEVTNKSLFDVLAGDVKIKDVRALLWAGLLHETPNLTLQQAGQLIDDTEGGVMEILDGLTKAAVASLPEIEQPTGEESDPLAVKNPSKV
jgi:hypothetical protein